MKLKFSESQVMANAADPEEESDQGLHGLQLVPLLLDALLWLNLFVEK